MATPQERYRIKNRDILNERKRNKYNENKVYIVCECGVKYLKHGKYKHIKSKNHINFFLPKDTSYGKIYKIYSKHTDLIYVGRTTKKLTSRLKGHKRDYKYFLNGKYNKTNITSFDLLKYDDCKIEELKKCYSEDELKQQEYYYISNLKCVNKINSGIDKKKSKREADRKYKNKLKIKYTCECGSILSKNCKTKHEKSKKHIKYIEQNNI